MARTLYEKDNTDLDGTTETVDRDVKDAEQATHLWQVSHDLDTTVTVTFYGTHGFDDAFDDALQLGSLSLSSGGDQGYETLTDPWESVQIEIAYGADPTSGSITVYEMEED